MKQITNRKLLAVVLGNLILGIGVAILRFSQMGNDPYCASTMAISEGLGMGLGTYQMLLNLVLFIFPLLWGRSYIGLGTIINLFLVGYIVQFCTWGLNILFGVQPVFSLPMKLVIMAVALVIVTFGLAMYQVASLGVAPYDFIALGLAEHSKIPYFILRVGTDAICVLVILIEVGTGFIGWENSHLGIGTVITAFFLGPLVAFFTKMNEKWVR